MRRLSELRDRIVSLFPEFVVAFPFEGMVGLFSILSVCRVVLDEFGIYFVGGEPVSSLVIYSWAAVMLWGVIIMTIGACRNSYAMRIAGINLTAFMQIARALMIWEGMAMSPLLWSLFIMNIVIALFCFLIAAHIRLVHKRVKQAMTCAELG